MSGCEPLGTQKKIKVYYFSGTGNTQLVAKKIVETFGNRGFTAHLFSMECTEKIELDGDDIIGLGFPVAVFTTFPIVFGPILLTLCRYLPQGGNPWSRLTPYPALSG